jgi:endoglucanase
MLKRLIFTGATMKSRPFSVFFILLLVYGTFFVTSAKDPKHGWLSTYKNYVVNERGNIVQLRGMSFYWSTPAWSGYGYYNAGTVNGLVDDWKCTVLRAAYDRNNGNDNGWDGVKTVIDASIAKGIYVILDWHSHSAHNQAGTAVEFFRNKANEYKDVPNMIFEVYNEPIVASGDQKDGSEEMGRKTWDAIKPYLTQVTKAIRGTGSKNLIILGTPYYCQHVGVAATDQVTDDNGKPFENVTYAFHFYAASHGPNAMYVKREGTGGMEAEYFVKGANSIPIFCSEWGTTHSDGTQEVDETNTYWWFDNYIDKYRVSWCNWSVSDFEGSSAFSGGGMNPSQSGAIVKKLLNESVDEWEPEWKNGIEGPAKDTVFDMPCAYHPAISFNTYYGSQVDVVAAGYSYRDPDDRRIPGTRAYEVIQASEATSDNWVAYNIKSGSATQYILFRYLSIDGSGTLEVLVDDSKTGELTISPSEDWAYGVIPADISTGEHKLKLNFSNTTGSYKIEWFELTNESKPPVVGVAVKRGISTLPVSLIPTGNGLSVLLPPGHDFISYSLFGADGRVVQAAPLHNGIRALRAEKLSRGIWFVKLEKNGSQQLLKTFVGSR